ncbi:hypothetical protein [Nocardia salmonicida]|uniref:hypothetical protein n=1 Tax=Nocardia salmonicida TaxID=53431 RepID=UPI0037BA1516
MPYELPEWAESKLRGVTREEVEEVLSAPHRWARPSTGGTLKATLIAGRTTAGKPVKVAVHALGPFRSLILAAGELTGEDLAEFEKWEVAADEPYQG